MNRPLWPSQNAQNELLPRSRAQSQKFWILLAEPRKANFCSSDTISLHMETENPFELFTRLHWPPLIQFLKFNNFFWVCWFLGKTFLILYPCLNTLQPVMPYSAPSNYFYCCTITKIRIMKLLNIHFGTKLKLCRHKLTNPICAPCKNKHGNFSQFVSNAPWFLIRKANWCVSNFRILRSDAGRWKSLGGGQW